MSVERQTRSDDGYALGVRTLALELFHIPDSSSLAAHCALAQAGAQYQLTPVDPKERSQPPVAARGEPARTEHLPRVGALRAVIAVGELEGLDERLRRRV